LPYDPQPVAVYAPNAYYVYFSTDDDYMVMAFLYNPAEHTTALFNDHANVYAIASSPRIGEKKFWQSMGLTPLIYSEMDK